MPRRRRPRDAQPPDTGRPSHRERTEESRPRRERPQSFSPRERPVRPAPIATDAPAAEQPPTIASTSGLVRVSKLLAERGLCSRREADEYIEKGWVWADGERVSQLGTRVSPDAVLRLDNKARAARVRLATILLNKPVGHVSGQPEDEHPPAVALIRPENLWEASPPAPGSDTPRFDPAQLRGLAPAGRLDIDSTGLLVLTQDGTVARHLIGSDSEVDKEYLVRVEGEIISGGLALLNHGLELDGEPLRPAQVEWLNDDQLRFVLREGRKRQIRRMCELVGLRVTGLKRVRIGGVMLGDLPLGRWRYLGADEEF
jgi:23S rRNA pseudouridine2604 synthase